jgi:hypothetical protein
MYFEVIRETLRSVFTKQLHQPMTRLQRLAGRNEKFGPTTSGDEDRGWTGTDRFFDLDKYFREVRRTHRATFASEHEQGCPRTRSGRKTRHHRLGVAAGSNRPRPGSVSGRD